MPVGLQSRVSTAAACGVMSSAVSVGEKEKTLPTVYAVSNFECGKEHQVWFLKLAEAPKSVRRAK